MTDFITIIKYIVLGLIQGFTEPLPISSSGHVYLLEELFDIHIEGAIFESLVNLGSMIAIVFIYRKDIIKLITDFFNYIFKKNKEPYQGTFNYILLLIIGVIPVGIIGVLIKIYFYSYLKQMWLLALAFFITGISLLVVTNYKLSIRRNLTVKDALVIGAAQIFSVFFGISRSGSTMIGGIIRKLEFSDIMRFSFLMYIPISLAAIIINLPDYFIELEQGTLQLLPLILAFISSIFATYIGVKALFNIVSKNNLKYFGYYCIILSTSLFIYIITK